MDEPNFKGSWYSLTKGMVDVIVRRAYPNVLHLRIRMPLSDDLRCVLSFFVFVCLLLTRSVGSPRNFITKITHYQKVVNIPNSMTILTEFLPLSIDMAMAGMRGVYNFTNPG